MFSGLLLRALEAIGILAALGGGLWLGRYHTALAFRHSWSAERGYANL